MHTCGKAKTTTKDPQPSPSGANLNSRKNSTTAKPSRRGYHKPPNRSPRLMSFESRLNDLTVPTVQIVQAVPSVVPLRLSPRFAFYKVDPINAAGSA